MNVYDRIADLGIELRPMAAPAAAYAPFVKLDDLVFLSGHLARRDGQIWTGRLGGKMTVEEGGAAARSVGIDLISTLHTALEDLNRIEKIVKLTVLVNSTASFPSQHLVANGASELLGAVFPKCGPHSRSAYGVSQLPLRSCVEIELIAKFR